MTEGTMLETVRCHCVHSPNRDRKQKSYRYYNVTHSMVSTVESWEDRRQRRQGWGPWDNINIPLIMVVSSRAIIICSYSPDEPHRILGS